MSEHSRCDCHECTGIRQYGQFWHMHRDGARPVAVTVASVESYALRNVRRRVAALLKENIGRPSVQGPLTIIAEDLAALDCDGLL